jgi:drug/metabolite transporter (DMT)-like permease
VLAGVALACYLVATRTELVAVAVVLSSLYPVIPVLLGVTVLGERLSWRQTAGLVGALAASVLISTA